ncbi:MAG TPA: hypothetical protein VIO85_12195 [Candidatus Dormibacteraeota bacterium]
MTRAPLERDVSPNPYDDVPEELAKTLEDYVLVADENDLLDDPGRMDALTLLFKQLDEIYDEPRLRSKWAAAHRNRGFRVGVGNNGYFGEVGHNGQAVEVPDHLVNSLITQILELPRQERYAAFMATSGLVNDWFHLSVDGEKLLGHLLRGHSASNELISLSDEDLWAAHTKLHEKARKGSAREWRKFTSAHALHG